jgi:hypothetical protein
MFRSISHHGGRISVLLFLIITGYLATAFLHVTWGERVAQDALPVLLFLLGSGSGGAK